MLIVNIGSAMNTKVLDGEHHGDLSDHWFRAPGPGLGYLGHAGQIYLGTAFTREINPW